MSRAERAESVVQVGLMLAVGTVAGCASWSHVVSLAEAHGQRGWLAQAVAACTETMAVSGGLEVRRRRRAGQPAAAAVAVVIGATVLQLAAQISDDIGTIINLLDPTALRGRR